MTYLIAVFLFGILSTVAGQDSEKPDTGFTYKVERRQIFPFDIFNFRFPFFNYFYNSEEQKSESLYESLDDSFYSSSSDPDSSLKADSSQISDYFETTSEEFSWSAEWPSLDSRIDDTIEFSSSAESLISSKQLDSFQLSSTLSSVSSEQLASSKSSDSSQSTLSSSKPSSSSSQSSSTSSKSDSSQSSASAESLQYSFRNSESLKSFETSQTSELASSSSSSSSIRSDTSDKISNIPFSTEAGKREEEPRTTEIEIEEPESELQAKSMATARSFAFAGSTGAMASSSASASVSTKSGKVTVQETMQESMQGPGVVSVAVSVEDKQSATKETKSEIIQSMSFASATVKVGEPIDEEKTEKEKANDVFTPITDSNETVTEEKMDLEIQDENKNLESNKIVQLENSDQANLISDEDIDPESKPTETLEKITNNEKETVIDEPITTSKPSEEKSLGLKEIQNTLKRYEEDLHRINVQLIRQKDVRPDLDEVISDIQKLREKIRLSLPEEYLEDIK